MVLIAALLYGLPTATASTRGKEEGLNCSKRGESTPLLHCRSRSSVAARSYRTATTDGYEPAVESMSSSSCAVLASQRRSFVRRKVGGTKRLNRDEVESMSSSRPSQPCSASNCSCLVHINELAGSEGGERGSVEAGGVLSASRASRAGRATQLSSFI